MQTGKRAALRTKEIEPKANVVASVELVVRAPLHDSVEDDFVHSIAGRIIAEPENRGEEDAGQIRASLVQFGAALDRTEKQTILKSRPYVGNLAKGYFRKHLVRRLVAAEGRVLTEGELNALATGRKGQSGFLWSGSCLSG